MDNRKRNPTHFLNNRVALGETVAKKIRRETFEAAKSIHGGTKTAASVGLLDTALESLQLMTVNHTNAVLKQEG